MKANLWRRLSPECASSLAGAAAVAVFQVGSGVVTALDGQAERSDAALVAGLAAIAGTAALFATAAVVRLSGGEPDRLRGVVVVWGAVALGTSWVTGWAVASLWVTTVFLVARGLWGVVSAVVALCTLYVTTSVEASSPAVQYDQLALALLGTFAVYVPIRLVLVSDELLVSREQFLRLHVDEERGRIEQELHDVMGRTLVSASLRVQTALRLLERGEAPRAAEQLTIAHGVIDDSQEQLRALVHGPTIVDLDSEVAGAEQVCLRTGVRWDAELGGSGSPATRRLVAAVLREAVTNMLKHSRPSTCWLRVREEDGLVVVSVTNDGCPEDLAVDPRGTGLQSLGELCREAGGTLDAGSPRDGLFRVLARIPSDSDSDGQA